jgi:hypothetical protein
VTRPIDPRVRETLVSACRTGCVTKAGARVVEILAEAGLPVRRSWSGPLPSDVRKRLMENLIHDHGVPVDRFKTGTREGGTDAGRAGRLALSNREKSGAAAINRDRVLIRPQPGADLVLNGATIRVPEGGWIALRDAQAHLLEAPGIILVENLEVFESFERLSFPVPLCRRRDVLVFRGAPFLAPQDAAERFLKAAGLPVTAFPDFDPSGLANAMSAPGCRGLLWPGGAALRRLLRAQNRKDLYAAQIDGARSRLLSAEGVFAEAAGIVMEEGRGLVQEAFLDL